MSYAVVGKLARDERQDDRPIGELLDETRCDDCNALADDCICHLPDEDEA